MSNCVKQIKYLGVRLSSFRASKCLTEALLFEALRVQPTTLLSAIRSFSTFTPHTSGLEIPHFRRESLSFRNVRKFHASSVSLDGKDYYELFGVSKGASDQDIKKSYYQLAKKYHPDANKDNADAAKKFQEIQKAYEILRDPEKRQMYDQVGRAGMDRMEQGGGGPGGFPGGFPGGGFPGGFPGGFGPDFFAHIFGGDMFQRVNLSPIQISFMESVRGTKKRVTVPDMRGGVTQLDLDIPPGADDGDVLQTQLQPVGGSGKPPMTVLIPIEVAPHPSFRRDGLNVLSSVSLPFAKALMGTTVQVETIDGSVELIVPPCSRHGDRLRIRAKGFLQTRRGINMRGDQLVDLSVSMPAQLNARQRALLDEFQREEEGKFRKKEVKKEELVKEIKEEVKEEAKKEEGEKEQDQKEEEKKE